MNVLRTSTNNRSVMYHPWYIRTRTTLFAWRRVIWFFLNKWSSQRCWRWWCWRWIHLATCYQWCRRLSHGLSCISSSQFCTRLVWHNGSFGWSFHHGSVFWQCLRSWTFDQLEKREKKIVKSLQWPIIFMSNQTLHLMPSFLDRMQTRQAVLWPLCKFLFPWFHPIFLSSAFSACLEPLHCSWFFGDTTKWEIFWWISI